MCIRDSWNRSRKLRIDTYGFQYSEANAELAELYEDVLDDNRGIKTKNAKKALLEAVATKANQTELGGRRDWTAGKTEQQLLGWFLDELRKKGKRGSRFVNLNVLVSAD